MTFNCSILVRSCDILTRLHVTSIMAQKTAAPASTASVEGSTSAQAPSAVTAPTSTASMPVPMQQTRSQTSSLLKSLETLARDLRYRDMLYYLLDVDRKVSSALWEALTHTLRTL